MTIAPENPTPTKPTKASQHRNHLEDAEYMSVRDVPKLFNEMANSLLKHRPEDVLLFLSHWINHSLWERAQEQQKQLSTGVTSEPETPQNNTPLTQQHIHQMHLQMQMQMQMHQMHMHQMHMQRVQSLQGEADSNSTGSPQILQASPQQHPPPMIGAPLTREQSAGSITPPIAPPLFAPFGQAGNHASPSTVLQPITVVENPRPAPESLAQQYEAPNGRFDIKSIISEGHYGVVYKAEHLPTGEMVAVKKVPIEGDWVTAEYDHMLHCSKNSRRTVRCTGCYYEPMEDMLWIVMELMGKSLESLQPTPEADYYDEETIKRWVRETVYGLIDIHDAGRVHLDIKPANILHNPTDGTLMIADFGTMQALGDKCIQLGDFCYMAPEVAASRGSFVDKSDIWSVGALAVAMTDGNPPLHREDPTLLMYIHDQTCMMPSVWEPFRWTRDYVDFLFHCFQKDPIRRPSARELLHHPWLSNNSPTRPLSQHQPEDSHQRPRSGDGYVFSI